MDVKLLFKDSSVKMHTALKILITIIVSQLSVSCIPEPLEVKNVPIPHPEIVVNTQIVPDESVIVFLSKTVGALEASEDSDPLDLFDQIAVNDAVVTISDGAGIDTLLFLSNGVYGGIDLDLNEGQTYHLHIVSESLGTVTSSTTVKPRISFEDVNANLYFNNFDDTLVQVTYTIEDLPGKNYYMLNVQHISVEDGIFERILNPRVYTRLLDDSTFEGEEFRESFLAYPRDYQAGDSVAVFLSNISKHYYEFVQLRLDNRYSAAEFVSEPLNYPTNVIGGRGFFNLHTPTVEFFILEEME